MNIGLNVVSKEMISNDDGEGKEKVRSSGCRSFQRRGAVMDIARLHEEHEMRSDRVARFEMLHS